MAEDNLPMGRSTSVSQLAKRALWSAVRQGETELVRFLLASPVVDLQSELHTVLTIAASKSYPEIVTLLMRDPRVAINAAGDNYNEAIRMGARYGCYEPVRLLLTDPRTDPERAISLAANGGFARVVALLLRDPRVNPAENDNYPIRVAAVAGYTDIVNRLLADPRVDPGALNIKNFGF